MIHTRLSSLTRPISLVTIMMVAGLTGCQTTPLDTTEALDSLDAIHARLVEAAQEQTELSRDLAASLTDIAAERVRLALLLDIDELLTPDGQADREVIERLLREGSDNAVVNEVRLGRMTLDEAVQLTTDAARASDLSPSLRSAAEGQIVSQFADWKRITATREAILSGLDERRQASTRLLDEATQLTSAIRQATTTRRHRAVQVDAMAHSATSLIPDPDLRESIASLLDALLAKPTQSPVARSQDQ